MFDKILSFPVNPEKTCGKSSMSNVQQGLEFIHFCINYFRKDFAYLFTAFD